MALIELKSVVKQYPKRSKPALQSINLTIEPATRTVLGGVSGSGKTTLLQIMGLLTKPSKGKVLICGEDTAQWKSTRVDQWRNSSIGFVFQHYCLVPELNILDNVNLPARIQGKSNPGLPGEKLLREVGLNSQAKHYPHQLSGGEAQRVAIARALANRPQIVLADEPTGNLDVATGHQVIRVLLSLQQQYGYALVIVTHNGQLVKMISGKKLWLADGSLHRVRSEEESLWGVL